MLIKTLWINWTLLNFIVTNGYDDLSANKTAHQYKTASSCQWCLASKAVDRNVQTCARMNDIGTSLSIKSTWWYVDLGGIHSVYNIRIQFKDYGSMYTMRQRGRFAGFSLYVSNTTDRHSGYLCYKDENELPPLDFNTTCITHGRYVIFYNERLPGITYPTGYELSPVFAELCEVTVTGCFSGDYGENCDTVCPENCQERRCDIINGACLGCTPGWLEVLCDKACPVGYYGLQCESKCVGHCKDSVGCNRSSGLCDNGCDDGWTGSNCTKGCEIGTFGKGCSNWCSGHCLNNVSCISTTGHCDNGCAPGFVEPFCNKTDLEFNAFSDNCNEPSYIAGLSVLVIICTVLSSVCLLFIWKYYRLEKKVRSLQYASIIRTSTQDNNANNCQQYEELRISDSRYHNIELRN